MSKKLLFVCASFWLGWSMHAQNIDFQCSFPQGENSEFHWYVQPMENSSPEANVEMKKGGNGLFNATLKAAADGLYKLYRTSQSSQLMVPFYLPGEGSQEVLNFQNEKDVLSLLMNNDNRALSEYNAFMIHASRKLWSEGKDMSSEQLLAFLKSYSEEASRLIEKYHCAATVCDYLKMYAYTSAYSDCLKLDFITHKSASEIGFTALDFLEKPEKMLDTPMAKYFYSTNQIILSNLPKGSLESKLEYLRHNYKCKLVELDLEDSILLLYLSNFNYDKNYDAGLREIELLTSKYGLSDVYLKKFKARQYARKGAPFPSGVCLKDIEGNEISFEKFKGYYVYVDMWASWCVPCCREVPYLQQLEKSLRNKKVKFVSISTDTRISAWKNRMKLLKMEGNQLIESEGKLGEALNITGIPHFLIYDKEGKLLYYKAPRPSQGEDLKSLLENLE